MKISIGEIRDVSGEVMIASGDIGYTAKQVSALLTQIATTFQPKAFDGRCPYKGLDVFEEEDAGLFFGRERLVEDLTTRVKESRTVFITGPSGSGKSSLVRAGLIPALKRGYIKGSERWIYETMKPGREPIQELALIFSRFKSPELANYFRDHANQTTILTECAESVLSGRKDQRFVLFVDQFEEVFTQVSQEDERKAFINMLAHAGMVEDGRVIVLFAMRSDFVSNCAVYPTLNELLSQQFRQVGAMRPEELVSAIALPAKHVGLPIEDELIARIINDMKGEPGALPLMQFALKDLFESQQTKGGVIALRLEDYLQQGGIHRSLERHADNSFAQLNKYEQKLARYIFSGLIEIGHGTQDTRRIALFDELVPASVRAEDVLTVVQKLADARLIITDEQGGVDTVTISHEKLIDAWPWLRKLVDQNRDVIALQNEIAGDAKEWNDHGRDPSYLYTGARLAIAREKIKTLTLSEKVDVFLQESMTTQEIIRQQEERRRHWMLGLSLGFSVLLFGLFVFSLIQLRTSRAQQLGFQAQVAFAEQNYNAAALYAYQAHQIHSNDAATEVLAKLPYENFELSRGLLGPDIVTSVAWSTNGRLASGSWDGAVITWDLVSGQPAQVLKGHTSWVYSVAWSTDDRLASGSADNTVIVWDLTEGKPAQILKGHTDLVTDVAWSEDGRLTSSSWDGTIIIWDLVTGQPAQILKGHTDRWVISVAWSADGRLASGSDDGNVIIWDLVTDQPAQTLKGHAGDVTSVAWSTDGRLASGSGAGDIIVWNLITGQPAQTLKGPKGFKPKVSDVAWSTDGRLASSLENGSIIIWDLVDGRPIHVMRGHTDEWVTSLSWSADGRLVSGSADKTIIIWDLANEQPIQTLDGHTDAVNSVAWSIDGHLASGSYDGAVIIWDLVTGQPAHTLKGDRAVYDVAWSGDGLLAYSSANGEIIIWNTASGQPVQTLKVNTSSKYSVAWSTDGHLASSAGDNNVILWDLTNGRPAQILKGHTAFVTDVAWSKDGRLSSSSMDGTVIVWDLATGQPAQTLKGHTNAVISVDWSKDDRIASGSYDKTVIVWDLVTGQPAQTLRGHTDAVISVAWSTDGLLASGSLDNSVIIWDPPGNRPTQILKGHTDQVNNMAWSADGRLASGSNDGTISIPRLNLIQSKPCDWIYRNMTADEWLSSQGILFVYQPTCPNLSIPKFNPANNILSAITTGNVQEAKMALITWKGRVMLLVAILIFILLLTSIFWILNKSISWLWQKMPKRIRKESSSR